MRARRLETLRIRDEYGVAWITFAGRPLDVRAANDSGYDWRRDG